MRARAARAAAVAAVAVAMMAIAVGSASAQPAGTGTGTGTGSGTGSATGSGTGSGTGSATGSPTGSGTIIQIPADAEAPEVSASASPSQLVLGARFTLFVTAAYGEGVVVNLREPMDLGPAFEIVRHASTDRIRGDGKHVREWQLEVYAWDVGDLQVPPVAVTFTVAGRAGQVETNAVPLHVSGVLGDVDDPKLVRPDAPPRSLIHRDWTWLWIAGGAVLAIAGLATVLWFRRRRRLRLATLVAGLGAAAPSRIDAASERALSRLLAIEQSGALAREPDRKRGYVGMVEAVRDYLGERYHMAVAELTPGELVRAIERAAPAHARPLVTAWFERCELVIYAGARGTTSEAHAVLADARALVAATTPARAAREAA